MKKTDHSHGYSFDIHKTKKVLIGSRFNSMKSEYLTFQCSLMPYQRTKDPHYGIPSIVHTLQYTAVSDFLLLVQHRKHNKKHSTLPDTIVQWEFTSQNVFLESAVRGWAAPIAADQQQPTLCFRKKIPLTSSRPMHIPCTSHKGIQTPYTKCQPSSNLTQLGNSIKG